VAGGDGWVLELPGMMVDVLDPPAHQRLRGAPRALSVRANVAMMCGCPITDTPATNPWLPSDFDVSAQIREVGGPDIGTATLTFPPKAPPSLFTGTFQVPPNLTADPIFYEAIVSARQRSTGTSARAP